MKFLLLPILLLSVSPGETQKSPNFVVILTDDQDLCMNSLMPMKKTRELVADAGATFTNFFTSSPICCPSRATFLTGQFAHNTRTFNNSLEGGCYGSHWRSELEANATIAVMLKNEGYRNFYAGKYLNQYEGTLVPAGYDDFHGLHGNSRYYNYSVNVNGVVQKPETYFTDYLTSVALDFIRNAREEPFSMIIAPPAPHEPFTPADKYRDRFANEKVPQKPNFNVVSEDKHWLLNHPVTSALNASELARIDGFFGQRWATLLSVDDLVEAVIQELKSRDLLDSTYVFYTSDNGYHLGQFAQPFDKRQPYECDIRVPLLVRGPEIPPKSVINDLSGLVDLAPTILELAGVIEQLDGVSLVGSLKNLSTWTRTNLLIEYWGEGGGDSFDSPCPWRASDHMADCHPDFDCRCSDTRNNTYACVRNIEEEFDYLYCEFSDHQQTVEMYNLLEDPYQLHNIGSSELPAIRANFQLRLADLRNCKGMDCIL